MHRYIYSKKCACMNAPVYEVMSNVPCPMCVYSIFFLVLFRGSYTETGTIVVYKVSK